MGGYVYKGGQVQRVTITAAQLEQVARLLGITAPEQVQGISLSITQQPTAPGAPQPPQPARTP
jgi:hypothetical protein